MSVPKFFEFFNGFLQTLSDGQTYSLKEIRVILAKEMGLTSEDLSEMLPSGKQSTYDNRVAWAKTYLCKAGLISLPKRGHCQITDEGRKALASGKTIDLPFLNQYKSFRDFHSAKSGQSTDKGASSIDTLLENAETVESPMEILDGAFKQVTNTLASELMDEVMKLTPSEFESMVVKLLLRMGYGSGIDNAGIVTKQSGDGGIDGIIKEDQLGFSSIYIQAKQWAPDRKVDRPEIQKFAGALQGEKATKGLFITTALFTSGAKMYVENLRGSTIVLVDGNQLTHLMIKYNLGVSVEHVYEVKRIDTDFFAEGL